MGHRVLAGFTTRHGENNYTIGRLTGPLPISYGKWEAQLLRSMSDVETLTIDFLIEPERLERILAASAEWGSKIFEIFIDLKHDGKDPDVPAMRDAAVASLGTILHRFAIRKLVLCRCGLNTRHWKHLAERISTAARSLDYFRVENNPFVEATPVASLVTRMRNLSAVFLCNCGLRYNAVRMLVHALRGLWCLSWVDLGDNPPIPRSDATVASLLNAGGPPGLRSVVCPSTIYVNRD